MTFKAVNAWVNERAPISEARWHAVLQVLELPPAWTPEGTEPPAYESLPLIGMVNAGSAQNVDENRLGEVRVSRPFLPRGKAYVLKIEGRSMSPTLEHGDLVVVDVDAEPRPGDILVVTLPGQGTVVRQLVRRGKRLLLEAEAEGYEPYPRDEEEVLIHGVVHAIVGRTLR